MAFNVGDKVKIIGPVGMWEGSVGVIEKRLPTHSFLPFQVQFNGLPTAVFAYDELKLVEKRRTVKVTTTRRKNV